MSLMLLLPLSMLGLVAVSIYVLVSSSNLSLPIPLETRILTIILPFLAIANVYYAPILRRISQERNHNALIVLAPSTVQILQGILTIVLATLSFEGIVPGASFNCTLRNNWQQLWRSHNSRAIERIQDTLNCCGYASLKDMSEPHRGTDTSLCGSMYHRSTPCIGPWTSALQRNSGLEFGVTIAVGIIQLVHLAYFHVRNSYSDSTQAYERLNQRVRPNSHDRLLENGSSSDPPENTVEDETRTSAQDYGSTNNNATPWVEPSRLRDDSSSW